MNLAENIRTFRRGRSDTAHDDFGETALEGILSLIDRQDEKARATLKKLWERLSE